MDLFGWLTAIVIAALVAFGFYGSFQKGSATSRKVEAIKKQIQEANAEVRTATSKADEAKKEADSARDTDSNTIALDKFNKRFGG